jgi:hypothetical protein
MNCPLQSEGSAAVLLDYCAGAGTPATNRELAGHLDACERCRKFCEEQAHVWNALDEWRAPAVTDGFDRRLSDRMSETPFWQRSFEWVRQLSMRPALPVAVAVLVLAAGALFRQSHTGLPGARPALVGAADAEQVERALDDVDMLGQLDAAADGGAPRHM